MNAFIMHAAAAGARGYMLLGEVLSVSVLMIALNALATITEKIYVAGATIGSFYKTHKIGSKIGTAAQHIAAALILVSELAWEGAMVIYDNREDIMDTMNTYRNRVGVAFAYTSPAIA